MSLLRETIDALLPPGPKWTPQSGGDFDLFLDGLADGFEPIKLFMDNMAKIRDPSTTTYLSDLEREYGILTKTNLSEDVRREQLAVKMFGQGGTGGASGLQNALQQAGFDVQVHENDPAVDPTLFLDQSFQVVLGDTNNAFVGDPNAYLGRIGGILLVNGPVFEQQPKYLSELGGPNSYVGDPLATLGDFDELIKFRQEFPIPTDPDSWRFIFFVGGDATRDGSGFLTDIEQAEIPSELFEEFEAITVGYKPLHAWAGLVVTLT